MLSMSYSKYCLGIILILVFFTECNKPFPSTIPSTTVTNTIIPTRQTPVLSTTQSPTGTRELTAIFTSTPKINPTYTPTWMPRPTLSLAEAMELVLELLQSNGGCKFPCWWGITPGVTRWAEAQAFLRTFASRIIQWNMVNLVRYYGVDFSVPISIKKDGIFEVSIDVDRGGVINQIKLANKITLNDFLTDYGKPQEIWIFAVSSDNISYDADFTIVLFYTDQGIMATFDGIAPKAKIINICPSTMDEEIIFVLWPPNPRQTFTDVAGPIMSWASLDEFRFHPLKDATNMSIDTFYETYKDSKNAGVCFEMPDPDLPAK